MFDIRPEVKQALAERRPVVALESTLVAHGMPFPENLAVARAAEARVRAGGATPATVAVLSGRVTIGVSEAELEQIAAGGFVKLGQADLGPACACRVNGATTVSATAFVAARTGITVFATGGIGGVHRGDAGDVSSDLTTLAREPVVVVSAGAKAILDLPRTLEMLETLGVLVLGYGTSEWPAFYTRRSGLPLEHRADDPASVAAIVRARFALGDRRGVLIANPISEAVALDEREIAVAIDIALSGAASAGVRGKALTPFLLSAIATATGNRSLVANRALVLENCGVAAAIAAALCG